MKIYTKGGDKGMTSLIGGERVFKTDLRVEAYGTVDELSAHIALLTDYLRGDDTLKECVEELNTIASRLMNVQAILACGERGSEKIQPMDAASVKWLEEKIDAMQAQLPTIDKFTIPGGDVRVSYCNLCRTVCRRAERAALRIEDEHPVDGNTMAWINRLSDYLYVLSRKLTAHYHVEETLWIP